MTGFGLVKLDDVLQSVGSHHTEYTLGTLRRSGGFLRSSNVGFGRWRADGGVNTKV